MKGQNKMMRFVCEQIKTTGKKGRSEELLKKRNVALCKRFYYYVNFKKMRYADALNSLVNDFYLTEAYMSEVLMANDTIVQECFTRKTTVEELKKDLFNLKFE